MSGPHRVRPTKLQPCEAWQVEAGDEQLRAAARWSGIAEGIWGEDAPDQVVWLSTGLGQTPARVGDWIVRPPHGPIVVLTPEQFANTYEVVEGTPGG